MMVSSFVSAGHWCNTSTVIPRTSHSSKQFQECHCDGWVPTILQNQKERSHNESSLSGHCHCHC